MNTPTRRLRRGRTPAGPVPSGTLGGTDQARGSVSTLELVPENEIGRPAGAGAAHGPPGTAPEPDALAADRFYVDPEEWGEQDRSADPADPAANQPPPVPRTVQWRLSLRGVLVVLLGLCAFHHSIGSLAAGIASGSVVVYVLVVPLVAALAGTARVRRGGYPLDAAVGLVDVLVGSLLCLGALGVTTLLGPGLSGVYGLWRVDLLMLWVFLVGTTAVSLGLRSVRHFWLFWAVLLLLWPFPVRLANAAAGSAVGGALLLLAVTVGVVAYGHRPGDRPRWPLVALVGGPALVLLVVLGLAVHPQRLVWPAALAACVAAVAWWATEPLHLPSELVPGRRVRGTTLILVVLAVVGLVALPAAPRVPSPSSPTGITNLSLGPWVVPGYVSTATTSSAQEQHYFGRTSTWQRVSLRQGDTQTGPTPDGRAVVVDVLSTPRPQVLALYPVVTTYPMGTLSSVPDAEVDLGHGVSGQLYRAEDARAGIAYTLLTFSWRLPVDMSLTGSYTGPPAQLTQRVTLIAVDDRAPGAQFPEPGNAVADGIVAALTSIGSDQRVRHARDLQGDEQLLTDTGRSLVTQRLTKG